LKKREYKKIVLLERNLYNRIGKDERKKKGGGDRITTVSIIY
jgi:hypothetical protein